MKNGGATETAMKPTYWRVSEPLYSKAPITVLLVSPLVLIFSAMFTKSKSALVLIIVIYSQIGERKEINLY